MDGGHAKLNVTLFVMEGGYASRLRRNKVNVREGFNAGSAL